MKVKINEVKLVSCLIDCYYQVIDLNLLRSVEGGKQLVIERIPIRASFIEQALRKQEDEL